MKKVLITKGSHSGAVGHIVYKFYRAEEGYCQTDEPSNDSWERVYWVVPVFDRCGKPKIVELCDSDFVYK